MDKINYFINSELNTKALEKIDYDCVFKSFVFSKSRKHVI